MTANGIPRILLTALKRGVDPLLTASYMLKTYAQTGRSIAECHTPGLDSVVLYDQPDGMVRFYYAHKGRHTLHQLVGPDGHFTVGIHNHKYEIAKLPLIGPLINLRTHVTDHDPEPGMMMNEFGFRSALKGGGMEVEFRALRRMAIPQPDILIPGQVSVMAPEDLHTVLVDNRYDTAWMVVEGPPVEIEPLIYSPERDLKIDPAGLYVPMSAATAAERIASVLDNLGSMR